MVQLEFFIDSPSCRTLSLGSTQSVTQMTNSCLLGEGGGWLAGKGGRCVGLTTLPPSCADCLEIMGASTFWNPNGTVRACIGIALVLILPPVLVNTLGTSVNFLAVLFTPEASLITYCVLFEGMVTVHCWQDTINSITFFLTFWLLTKLPEDNKNYI